MQGLKIPLEVDWNIAYLEEIVTDDRDKYTIHGLKYKWPLGHNGRPVHNQEVKNHKGQNSSQRN